MANETVEPESVARSEAGHGRRARTPSEIPARGWLDVAMRVKRRLTDDNASIVAAGLALYALLSIFPSLTAVVLLYGLFSSPAEITEQLRAFSGVLPAEGLVILERQLGTLASQQSQTLGFGLITAIAIALWSARKGMVALMTATNVAYNEAEERGFFKRLAVSLAFTFGAVLGLLLVLALGVAVPIGLGYLPLGGAAETVLLVLRWALLWLIAVLGLSVIYRFAPDRGRAQWRWVSTGSAIAATLWLGGSLLFAFYVRRFGASYGETYGALGGVVVMLLWLYISAFFVLLGAEINSEMERQTVRDTTEPPERPMGERNAYAADTIGPGYHRS